MTYTHIPVMYRDGANYKSYGTIVLEGRITPEQVGELRLLLPEQFGVTQFKPEALDMEHHAEGEGGWNDDWDHPWHNLLLAEIQFVDGPECFGNYVERPGTVREFIDRVRETRHEHWGTLKGTR